MSVICVLDAVRSPRLAFQKRTQARASSGGSVLARLEINLCAGCGSLPQIGFKPTHSVLRVSVSVIRALLLLGGN